MQIIALIISFVFCSALYAKPAQKVSPRILNESVYVEAGGDLMVTGTKGNGRPWRIGIRNPRPERTDELIVIGLEDKAIATSGDYMQPFTPDFRHHHIIDPRTGIPPPQLASSTVTAPNVALADSLATAAMVLNATELDPQAIEKEVRFLLSRQVRLLAVLIDDRTFLARFQDQRDRQLHARPTEDVVESLRRMGVEVHTVQRGEDLRQRLGVPA